MHTDDRKMTKMSRKRGGGKFSLVLAAFALLAGVQCASGEDGWIACDGTNFINTGYFVNPNMKVELDFAMIDPVTNNLQERLIGCYGASSNPEIPKFEYYIGRSSNGTRLFSYSLWSTSGGNLADNCYPVDDKRYTIIMDLPNKKWQVLTNGVAAQTKTYTWTPSPYTAKYPLGLFARAESTNCIGNASYWHSTKMKCYGLKIYESGNLVRNFVPCLKGGKPGMKEMISGQFHTGERLSAFTYGGDIRTEMDDPYIWTPRNVLKGIGAETNTFIDTGYYVKPQTRIALDFAMLTPEWTGKVVPWSASYNPYVFATYGNVDGGTGKSQNFTLYACASNGSSYAGCYYFNIGNGDNKLDLCPIESMYDIRRTFVLDSNSVRVITAGYTNCVKYSSSPLIGAIDTKSLKLMSQGTGTSRYSNWKIYGMKIWENDVLVKDYVPYVTNGVAGLLNTLDETDFLTSRTRTRYTDTYSDGLRTNVVFDVGGSLTNNPAEMEAYLEFNGAKNCYIRTDYAFVSNSCIEVDFSLWNTRYTKDHDMSVHDIFSQGASGSSHFYGIWLRFTAYGSGTSTKLDMQINDQSNSSTKINNSVTTDIPIDNSRMAFKFDALANKLTATKSGVQIYSKQFDKACTNILCSSSDTAQPRVVLGGSYAGGTRDAMMRLYSCKIHEDGVLKRCFVPYKKGSEVGMYDLVNGKAWKLTGGKVYGMGFRGTEDYPSEFQIAPEPTKLTKGGGGSTLTCLAAGAQSYEWYEDGVKIEGVTGDSLALTWTGKRPHVRTYSVVPVYSVLNDTVKGDPASAVVEYTPQGIVINIQ